MSNSPPQLSQQSLEEFEEYERIIEQNRAVDSSDSDDSSNSQTIPKEKEPRGRLPADTGYHSVGDFTFSIQDPTSSDRNDGRASSSSTSDAASVRSVGSSARMRHNATHTQSSDIDDNKSVKSATFASVSMEQNENIDRVQSGTDDDGKLVATFGTTENFQALLQRQLDDAEEESSSSEEPTPVVEEKRPATTPSSRVQLPRPRKPAYMSRTTRSPAANRARRASQKSKTWAPRSHSPGFPESSDDLSVHSDASRTELRRKLRKERVEREKEKSVKHQLQSEYDELVTKYAEAENVIDQLRIGAKIDIMAQLPDDADMEKLKKSQEDYDTARSEPILDLSHSPRSTRDAVTDSSLKLPAAANREFARIALIHDADELRGQMESFAALLDEGHHISDREKRDVLDSVISNVHKLENDSMKAARDHEAVRQAAILTGNASGALLEDFDPQFEIASKIFQLNRLLEDLKDKVAVGSSLPQTPVSGRRQFTTDEASETSESCNSNIDDRFDRQLKLYNKPALADDQSDTTVSSHFLSSDDTTVEFPVDRESRRDLSQQTSEDMPERFLRPVSSRRNSSSKGTARTVISNGDSSVRSSYSPSKADSTSQKSPDSRRNSKSRLPVLVSSSLTNERSDRAGGNSKKSPSSNEMDGDSGFVGSVSSRECMATKSPRVASRKQELSPVLSVPPSERSTISQSQQTRGLKPSARPRSASRHSNVSAPQSTYTQDDTRNESDYFKPDTTKSSASSRKGQKKKAPKSEDGSSVWSVPVRSAPPIPSHIRIRKGASGTPLHSSAPSQNTSLRETLGHGSEKSRPSSRRSTASRDSALDLIRGEIARLRQELVDNNLKAAETRPARGRSADRKQSRRRSYASDDLSTETESPTQIEKAPARQGRSRRRHSAQGRRSVSKGSENTGVTVIERRDAKSGSDVPLDRALDQAVKDETAPKGHWEYVAPYFSPAVATQILTPRHVPVPAVVATPLPQPAMVQIEPAFYSPVRYPSPARIYVPIPAYESPKTSFRPDRIVTVRTRQDSPRRSGRTRDSEENDRSLRRSHLRSPVKRSSSVPPLRQSILDPQLSLSLQRAERAADTLQRKSRTMYRSLRDAYSKAELSLSYV